MDEVANVYGRDPNAERALLIGSHTDTVPSGGWLDGALGRDLRTRDRPCGAGERQSITNRDRCHILSG